MKNIMKNIAQFFWLCITTVCMWCLTLASSLSWEYTTQLTSKLHVWNQYYVHSAFCILFCSEPQQKNEKTRKQQTSELEFGNNAFEDCQTVIQSLQLNPICIASTTDYSIQIKQFIILCFWFSRSFYNQIRFLVFFFCSLSPFSSARSQLGQIFFPQIFHRKLLFTFFFYSYQFIWYFRSRRSSHFPKGWHEKKSSSKVTLQSWKCAICEN